MRRAKELIEEYVEQETADSEEVLEVLFDFIVDHRLADDAAAALSAWFDEAGLADDFTTYLQQEGIQVED